METDRQKEHKEAFLRYVRQLETKADKLAEEHDKLQARCDVLLKALQKYGEHYSSCAVRWTIDNPKYQPCDCGLKQAITEVKKQGIIHGVNGIECGFPDRKEQAKK